MKIKGKFNQRSFFKELIIKEGKGSERQKSLCRKSKKEHQKSKIQNVERSERQKFEKDQNVENLKRIRTSKV